MWYKICLYVGSKLTIISLCLLSAGSTGQQLFQLANIIPKDFFRRSDMYGTKRTIISLCLLSAESTLPNWPTGWLLTQFLNILTLGFGRLSSFRLYNPPNHHYLDFLIIIQTSWSDTLPQFRLQDLISHHHSDFNI